MANPGWVRDLSNFDEKHDEAHKRLRKDLDKMNGTVELVKERQVGIQTTLSGLIAGLPGQLEAAVHKEIAYTRSFKKNGHGWKEWLSRVITPERIMWLLTALYLLGGQVNKAQTDIAGAVAQSKQATAQTQQVLDKVDENQFMLDQAIAELKIRNNVTQAKQDEFASQVKLLSEQLKAGLTRGEMQALVNQTLLPRINRIEAQQQQILARPPESQQ